MPPSPPLPPTADDVTTSPRVSVVIPALNEEDNLPLVLAGLPAVDEVIVVDGGSVDDTVAVAREVRPDAVIVRQTRSGKGNALVCGFEACTGDIVITLNADGTTDPGEIPRFVDALLAGAEIAHGSRYRDGGGNLAEHRLDRLGNRALNRLVNVLFGTRFTDLGYGYNAYWRTLLPALDLPEGQSAGRRRGVRVWGDGPEIEPLINIRMAAQGLRVVEVASVGYPRIHGAIRREPVNECVRALRTTVSEYLRRWKIGRHTDHNQDRSPSSTRHGARDGVGRGTRRAAPAIEEYGSFLPPERASTGRHAAHRAEPQLGAPYQDGLYQDELDYNDLNQDYLYQDDIYGDGLYQDETYDNRLHSGDPYRDSTTPGSRRHRYAEDATPRRGAPQQTAPQQTSWTHAPHPWPAPAWNHDTEPAAIDQGSRRSGYTSADVIPGGRRPNRADEPGNAAQRRGPTERRVAQRRQPADTVPPPVAWHPTTQFEPTAQRPDLTVLPGGAWPGPADGDRPRTAHLRAVPGEQYNRSAHRG